jgi:hypothetical protein
MPASMGFLNLYETSRVLLDAFITTKLFMNEHAEHDSADSNSKINAKRRKKDPLIEPRSY